MSKIVAIPIVRVSAKVVLDKGRGWSAIDELVLWALSRTPMTAAHLAARIGLPRRVVLEAIVRMMRFRLVEVVLDEGASAFQATAFGSSIVSAGDEIPALKKRLGKRIAFVVDRVTGTVFAKRDVRTASSGEVQDLRDNQVQVAEARVTGVRIKTSPRENVARFQEVLNRDETLVYFDGDTLIERDDEFMLMTVDGDDIRGLPEKAPFELKQITAKLAKSAKITQPIEVRSQVREAATADLPAAVKTSCGADDLVFGGPEHRQILEFMLGRAYRRLFIHSAFLRVGSFETWRPLLRAAARRGVKIEILWGAGRPDEPQARTLQAATEIAQAVGLDPVLRDRLRVHLASTGSHAKLLLGDLPGGAWTAVVGSCNWLYAGYERLELSVRLTNAQLVAAVADRLCGLVSRPTFPNELSAELYLLSQSLRQRPAENGPNSVGLVVGQMHEALLRTATTQANGRFLIACDKLGQTAFQNAIIPAEAAAKNGGAPPIVAFGQPSGPVSGAAAAGYVEDAEKRGVRLLRIGEGFHAKMLLWGDNDVVVTSLNWGSAFVTPDFPDGEIGVHMRCTGIARALSERLRLAWPQLP